MNGEESSETMEKKIDKDHLMNQLYDYLADEMQAVKYERDQQKEELRRLLREKNEKESVIADRNRMYRIRKIFSPLSLEIEEEREESSEDTIELEKKIQNKRNSIGAKEEKISQLREYLGALEENYFITESDINESKERVMFFPAFYELLECVKKVYPQLRLNFEKRQDSSKICMTFSFLKGFRQCMKFLIEEIGVFVINVEQFVDDYKILLQFHIKPKIPNDAGEFYKNRENLEKLWSDEFSVVRWKANSMIIQVLMEQ